MNAPPPSPAASSPPRPSESAGASADRCPHCGAVADMVPDAKVRFACSRCGGIRIPYAQEPSKDQLALLSRANVSRSAKVVWNTMAAVACGFGVLSGLVLLLATNVAHPPLGAMWAGALAVVITLAFAALAWNRGQSAAAQLTTELEAAWAAAGPTTARSNREEKAQAAVVKE